MRIRLLSLLAGAAIAAWLLRSAWYTSYGEYYYAVRHAAEIVEDSERLMDIVRSESETIDIAPLDPRVSVSIRGLSPGTIRVSENSVYIYTGGHTGKGFFVYRHPQREAPVASDTWKINGRLWWYEGA